MGRDQEVWTECHKGRGSVRRARARKSPSQAKAKPRLRRPALPRRFVPCPWGGSSSTEGTLPTRPHPTRSAVSPSALRIHHFSPHWFPLLTVPEQVRNKFQMLQLGRKTATSTLQLVTLEVLLKATVLNSSTCRASPHQESTGRLEDCSLTEVCQRNLAEQE